MMEEQRQLPDVPASEVPAGTRVNVGDEQFVAWHVHEGDKLVRASWMRVPRHLHKPLD